MVVYRSVPKTVGLLLSAVLLIGASGYMVAVGWGSGAGVVQVVIGVVGVLFFGFAAVNIGRQLARREPVLEIDVDGVRDVRLSKQVVPWPAVLGIRQVKVQKQKFVVLDLEPEFERGYLAGATRLMQRINQGAGMPGVHIGAVGLSVSADEIHDEIVRRWEPMPRAAGDDPVGSAG